MRPSGLPRTGMHFALAKCIPVLGSLDSPMARSAAGQRGVMWQEKTRKKENIDRGSNSAYHCCRYIGG